MTAKSARLTDELLRQSLTELAAGPDADELLTDVLRTVDGMAQEPRRVWDAPAWGRAGLLVAAVLLLTAAFGAAIALSRPRPEPTPSPPAILPHVISASDFVVPFTYSLPAGETRELHPIGPPMPATIYGRAGVSQELVVFLVTGLVHVCGPSLEGITLDTDPSAFLQGLRDEAGVNMGPISQTTMGNIPAVATELDLDTCSGSRIHENGLGISYQGYEPQLDGPSKLIVGRVGDRTIGVLISHSNVDDYVDWRPIAEAYVATFRFEPQADDPR